MIFLSKYFFVFKEGSSGSTREGSGDSTGGEANLQSHEISNIGSGQTPLIIKRKQRTKAMGLKKMMKEDPEMTAATLQEYNSVCRVCKMGQERIKDGLKEDIILCSLCRRGGKNFEIESLNYDIQVLY